MSEWALKFITLHFQDVPDGRGDRGDLRLHHPLLLRARLPLHLGLPLRVSGTSMYRVTCQVSDYILST